MRLRIATDITDGERERGDGEDGQGGAGHARLQHGAYHNIPPATAA